jgi:protease-4
MDKNRKILISILALLVLSAVLAVIDISMRMRSVQRERFSLAVPGVGPGVGVVRINGPIEMAGSEGGFTISSGGSEAIIQRIAALEADSRIKAVVVRINSPGGTVAATQEIYQKLMRLRQRNVVLVASLGDIAASGGYYIASACNYIVTNQGTLTGSIGVIAVSPNLQGLFQKLGIKMNVIKSGAYKDILSSYRDLTPEERELIQVLIDSSYNQFLKDVALGRNLGIDDIRPYADGRVMSGDMAVKYRLADEIGSFEVAVEKAKKKAKLPEDAPVYDEQRSPLDQFLMTLEGAVLNRSGLQNRFMRYRGGYMIEYRYQP